MDCFICGESLDSDGANIVQKPRKDGILTIISAAEKRQDIPAKRILQQREGVLNGSVNVRYHKTCRQNYTSVTNLYNVSSDSFKAPGTSKVTRSTGMSYFEIATMCLICNKPGSRNKQRLTAVQTGTGDSTRSKIIMAAQKRKDVEMIAKLENYKDLFASDAKYHRTCYGHYISERNIDAEINKHSETQNAATSYAEVTDEGAQCPATIHTENSSSEEEEYKVIREELTDLQVLHRAAEILKRNLNEFTSPTAEIPSPDAINSENFGKQVPNALLMFISWIIDGDSDDEFSINPKCAVLCNIIMSCYKKEFSKNNFHLGLGLFIYHTVRSRKLIDTLHNLRISCSYNEVRKLLTTLAKHKIQREGNIFVPYGIEHVDEQTRNYIHGSMDNFDLNEETLDGKSTTHAMAMVVFQQVSSDTISHNQQIPREACYSLSSEDVDLPSQKILKYCKPGQRPEPRKMVGEMDLFTDKYNQSKRMNLVWRLLRYFSADAPSIGWTDFHNALSQNNVPVSRIAYLPFLNAPPTEFDTIFTAMVRLVELSQNLGQSHVIMTADLAIYSKAQEILWNKPHQLHGKITLQLGGMHLAMALLASIGYIYGDGGLSSLLIETGLYAENSCKLVLEGKQFSRGIRALSLCADALSRLYFDCLIDWYDEQNPHNLISADMKISIDIALKNCNRDDYDGTSFEGLFNKMRHFEEAMLAFTEAGCARSLTFKYWVSFMEIVDLLWRLIRAERDGDFESHLCAVSDCLPYLRAAGRNLYSKWTPIYLNDMQELKERCPDMYKFLQEGNFVVKKTNEKRFNCVASDMALEQSINRDCKSSSGIVGFTQKPSALLRWMITRHILGTYSQNFIDISCETTQRRRVEGESARKRDVQDVLKMVTYLRDNWCNPFDLNEAPINLINICSGKVANSEIEKSLNSFREDSLTRCRKFQRDVLINRTDSFWKSEKRFKILNFKDNKTKKPLSLSKLPSIGSELMFRRIITAAKFKELDVSNILSYELTPFPASLFHDDGTMRKTSKCELAKKIESLSKIETERPKVQSLLIDGMVMIQELNERSFQIFSELAEVFLKNILLLSRDVGASRISVVFDSYQSNSLKYLERSRRGDFNGNVNFHIIGTRNVPKYRDFLKSADNKRALLQFVTRHILENGSRSLTNNETLIISGGFEDSSSSFMLHRGQTSELHELRSNQDEADTRLILAAIYECKFSREILVKSVDTDVLVLFMYYFVENSTLSETKIYIQLGHGSNKRYIGIEDAVDKLSVSVSKCLPSIHALTGSDTTNALYKIGKRSALEAVRKAKNSSFLQRLAAIATLDENESVQVATEYILSLYKGHNCKTLNDLRFHFTSRTNKSASELPPTDNSFRQHVLRCIHQIKIWTASHVAEAPKVDPKNFGWIKENGEYLPLPSTQEPIPDSVRNVLSIFCKDLGCTSSKCNCLKEGLKCCSECNCKNCDNQINVALDSANEFEDEELVFF